MKPLQLFKLLSDETRLKIILLLKVTDELCVCDIYTALNLSQPKTSRHLAMLREAGLLLDSKHGKWVHYRISPVLAPWIKNTIDQAYEADKNSVSELLKILGKQAPIDACTR